MKRLILSARDQAMAKLVAEEVGKEIRAALAEATAPLPTPANLADNPGRGGWDGNGPRPFPDESIR